MRDVFDGAKALVEGLRLIRQPGLKRYVAIPLLVNTLLFAGLIYYAGTWFEVLMARLVGWLPAWLDWLSWLLWPLFAIAAVLVVFYGFVLLANLIGAPFNGLLAEAVERHLTGQAPNQPGDLAALLKDVLPALLNELRKIAYFLLRAIPLLLLFVIPGVNLAAPFIWLLFSAWMLGLEYLDYPMDNHGIRFGAQRARYQGRRGLVQGFGLATLALTLIPVVNFIAMPAAVAGATALYLRRLAAADEAGALIAPSQQVVAGRP